MKRKSIIITIVICCAILLGATIFSIAKFGVWNPFSSCFGMIEILFTDKEYTIVQNYPFKVAFSKTSDTSSKGGGKYLLDEYMESRGFYDVPEERLGEMLVYSNGSKKEYIIYSTNKYYSKWNWK